jgi:hypothetical protein
MRNYNLKLIMHNKTIFTFIIMKNNLGNGFFWRGIFSNSIKLPTSDYAFQREEGSNPLSKPHAVYVGRVCPAVDCKTIFNFVLK